MRRLFACLSALAFGVALAGCEHTAGICDCDPCNRGCCCTCAGMGYRSACGASYGPMPASMPTPGVEAAPSPVKVGEPIKEMPKEAPKVKEIEKAPAPAKGAAPEKGKEEMLPSM